MRININMVIMKSIYGSMLSCELLEFRICFSPPVTYLISHSSGCYKREGIPALNDDIVLSQIVSQEGVMSIGNHNF